MKYTCYRQNIITVAQGSTYTDTVTLTQSNGSPLNLTGYTVRSQIRDAAGVLVGTFTCTVTDPTTGVIARSMAKTITAALVPSATIKHAWGIELTQPSGAVLPEIQGGVIVTPEVVQ